MKKVNKIKACYTCKCGNVYEYEHAFNSAAYEIPRLCCSYCTEPMKCTNILYSGTWEDK